MNVLKSGEKQRKMVLNFRRQDDKETQKTKRRNLTTQRSTFDHLATPARYFG